MSPVSSKTSTADALMLELRRLIAGVILFNQRVADKIGMNPTDMQCIHLVQLMGPLTAGKLAECTGLTTGGITVVLDRLERAGLVRREKNPNDRRSVLVHLQADTEKRMEEHYAEVGARTAAYFDTIPEQKLKTVLDFFKGMNSLGAEPEATNPDMTRKGAAASKSRR